MVAEDGLSFVLNQEYRQKNTLEFEYLVRQILGAAVSPKQNNFKRRRHNNTVIEIFSATDVLVQ